MKILFLSTGHYSLDDRIFYHQAKCLQEKGFEVIIVCTKELLENTISNIRISSYDDSAYNQQGKISKILIKLNEFSPDIIIGDTPLSIYASHLYKKNKDVKIIYDVTEWYPAKKNLLGLNGLKKYIKACKLIVFNIYVGLLTDYFIFGEHYKSIPFRFLFFWKSYLSSPYYPNINYIKYYPKRLLTNEINLLYSGIINTDKGIDNFFNAIKIASKSKTNFIFNVQIIGSFPNIKNKIHFENRCKDLSSNVHIKFEKNLTYTAFCETIGKNDLFFDLRNKDIENTHCLPIKLFYYLACGRPVIYSNLKSIKKEINNFDFGFIIDPTDAQAIADLILLYIDSPDLYANHADRAFEISRKKYNWSLIENDFVFFIENIK